MVSCVYVFSSRSYCRVSDGNGGGGNGAAGGAVGGGATGGGGGMHEEGD